VLKWLRRGQSSNGDNSGYSNNSRFFHTVEHATTAHRIICVVGLVTEMVIYF
jgi:hypothetical protein